MPVGIIVNVPIFGDPETGKANASTPLEWYPNRPLALRTVLCPESTLVPAYIAPLELTDNAPINLPAEAVISPLNEPDVAFILPVIDAVVATRLPDWSTLN